MNIKTLPRFKAINSKYCALARVVALGVVLLAFEANAHDNSDRSVVIKEKNAPADLSDFSKANTAFIIREKSGDEVSIEKKFALTPDTHGKS